MPQKLDLEPVEDTSLDLEPVEETTIAPELDIAPISTEEPTPEKGWLSKAYDSISKVGSAITEPVTEIPSEFARSIAQYIDEPSDVDPSYLSGVKARAKGFARGAVEGAGELVSSLTSPVNLALTALGLGELGAAKKGLTGIASAMRAGTRLASLPVVAHGAYQTARPNATLGERATGLVEVAGGLAGVRKRPITKPKLDLEPIEGPKFTQSLKQTGGKTLGEMKAEADLAKLPETPEFLSKLKFEDKVPSAKLKFEDKLGMPILPRELQGAKPRFNIGQNSYEPQFESDLDKALFIIAQKQKSLRDSSYLKFVMDHTGLEEQEARQLGNQIRQGIKSQLSGQEPGKVKISNIYKKPESITPEAKITIPKLNLEEIQIKATETPKISIKPRYKLDRETGGFIPIDETGKQIGPAQFEGKELRPELAKASKFAKATEKEPGKVQQYYDLARGTMSVDPPFMTSAAFRQAAPLVGTKHWFRSWASAAKSFGSEATHDAIQNSIKEKPLFKSTPGRVGGFETPSYADQVGLKLSDLGKYSQREEALRGQLAERIPVYGKYIRSSNRAYTSFLNNLRADTFETLVNDATKDGLNPQSNLVLGREIAEFVNTATSIGKLGVEIGISKKLSKEFNLERNARLLSNTFFSPRKISSEIRMLNPSTYIMANPFVRKQYLSALVRRIGTWWTIAGLAQMAGASVSKDPTNADFGKIKIGNTRIDPPGGLQQYLVLGSRIAKGGTTSSTSGKFTPFGEGFKPETELSTLAQFGVNRLHPTAKFATDLFNTTNRTPFHLADRIAQSALPMYTQDLVEVLKENPELAPLILGLSGAGLGTQTYEKGSFGKPTFIPEEYDLNIGGR